MDKKTFETTEEYRKFLSERLSEMDRSGRYNVFLHAVTNYTPLFENLRGDANQTIKLKIQAILKEGFLLNGYSSYGAYGSMNGTSKFVGEINSVENFDKIINYHYDNNGAQEYSVTLIMAIPKYIDAGDEIYELSSVEGDLPYAGQHDKVCLFDVVKGSYLPKSFNLGIQIINNKTGEVVFLNNTEHISSKSEQEQEDELKEFVNQIHNYVAKYSKDNHVDWQEVFSEETERHINSVSDFCYDID